MLSADAAVPAAAIAQAAPAVTAAVASAAPAPAAVSSKKARRNAAAALVAAAMSEAPSQPAAVSTAPAADKQTGKKQKAAAAVAASSSAVASSSSSSSSAHYPPRHFPSQHTSSSPLLHSAAPAAPVSVPLLPMPMTLPINMQMPLHMPLAAPALPFVFHEPPSLFRTQSLTAPPVRMTIAPQLSSAPLIPVQFPQAYTPVNLIRFLNNASPTFPFQAAPAPTAAPATHPFDYTLSQLWSFFDNPYGHEFHLLLDPVQLINPAADMAHSSAARPVDEGVEVYFVPYLSALVLYEAPDAANESSYSSPPLLQWFERVSPSQRMPVTDQIANIASCFSPSPSSPLYKSFSPFPSKRILFDLRCSALDLQRSWFAISWYPILHDPLTTPLLNGSFLVYHSFQVDAERKCPVQKSDFRSGNSNFSAAAAGASEPFGASSSASSVSSSVSPPVSIQSSVSPLPVLSPPFSPESSVDTGAETNGSQTTAADDADGESESDSEGAAVQRRVKGAQLMSAFPAHVCPNCGDRHGEYASAATAVSLKKKQKKSAAARCYLPLLGYMCHRVLPSTWFVHALLPKDKETVTTVNANSSSSPAATSLVGPHVQLKQHQQQTLAQQHQLESMGHFNASLNQPSPSPHSFSPLTLAHQPVRFTHADLLPQLFHALTNLQHPDFVHFSSRKE